MEKCCFLVLENHFGGFLVEAHDCGDGISFYKLDDSFWWEISSIVVDFFVEKFEEGEFRGIEF